MTTTTQPTQEVVAFAQPPRTDTEKLKTLMEQCDDVVLLLNDLRLDIADAGDDDGFKYDDMICDIRDNLTRAKEEATK